MSYFSAVSASNPQIWWRMNATGTLVNNSGTDATFATVSATVVATSNNRLTGTAASYANPSYFPAADQSCSLEQQYYPSAGSQWCSSSFQTKLTGVFDMFVTGGTGFSAEWLYKIGYGGGFSNNSQVWGWQNGANSSGMTFRTIGWPEAGTHTFTLFWQNAANSSQSLALGWGNNPNSAYVQPPRFGNESVANQGSSGTWGPHNGWHHFVFTMNAVGVGGGGLGANVLWVDGIQHEIDSAAGTNPPPSGAHTNVTDQKLFVGSIPTSNYAYHYISEVAFYSRTLSASEVMTHWAELARWNTNISATVLEPANSILYSVQAPAGDINYLPASSGTGNDPRATKTNPGAN